LDKDNENIGIVNYVLKRKHQAYTWC